MKTDTHVHIMCESFCGRGPTDIPQLLDDLASCGLDGAWVSSVESFRTRDLNEQKKHNDRIAALTERHPQHLRGFCTVDPGAMEAAAEEVERCSRDLALTGIKLHPWLQAFSVVAHPGVALIMEAAARCRMPVLFHDGTPPYCTPLQIASLAEQHPDAQVILGHCGLLDLWRDAVNSARRLDNLWLQPTCAVPMVIKEACEAVGVERMLFGSDAGFGSREYIDYCLQKFRWALGEDRCNDVLTKSPARLMALSD
jgi:predicted TIM-barrel fold metal-dependent hydrolase